MSGKPESIETALPVLLIDDDPDLQRSYALVFRHHGIENLVQCQDSRNAAGVLAASDYEVILLDLNMPHVSGRDLLPRIVEKHPDVPVIVVTGVDEVSTAVQCMRQGAFDYLVKPVGEEALIAAVRRAMDVRDIRRENTLLRERLLAGKPRHPEAFAEIVTAHPAMEGVFQYVEAVARTQQPILITGETGVGKELIARAIHRLSGRKGPFVPVNIAGLDDNLFSDTLFGHLKGAFTGATEARRGLIEQAADGTLFLDEIGDMTPPSQIKLLRLLQEREYLPLGADTPRRSPARIVVATNRDLAQLRQSKAFRDDLFFRLRSHHVHIPPLRERLDDLPLLTDHFLEKAARALQKKRPTPPRELFTLLGSYDFPGNVRELEGMIFNAVSTHRGGILSLEPFKEVVLGSERKSLSRPGEGASGAISQFPWNPGKPLPTIREAENQLILEALRRTGGNHTMAADLLGITRQTLNRRLKEVQSQR